RQTFAPAIGAPTAAPSAATIASTAEHRRTIRHQPPAAASVPRRTYNSGLAQTPPPKDDEPPLPDNSTRPRSPAATIAFDFRRERRCACASATEQEPLALRPRR